MMDFARENNPNQTPSPKPSEGKALAQKAFALHQKGDELFKVGRFTEARDHYQKSFEAYEAVGDGAAAGLALTRLGRAWELMGEYEQARNVYRRGLAYFERSSDLQGIARSKAHLGNIGWATGDYQESSNLLKEALSLYHVCQDEAGEAWIHDLMGNLRLAMREDEEAERHYRISYETVQKMGKNHQAEGWNLYHMAALSLFRSETEEAFAGFSEALKVFERLKDVLGQVAVLVHLGEIACGRRDIATAEKFLQKAVVLVLRTQCKPLLADALTGVAQLLEAKGDEKKAISILMVALSHPTCRQQTKDRMVSLIMALQSTFSAEEAQDGFQWAKAVGIEDMAKGWVTSARPNSKAKKAPTKKTR